MGKNLLIVESPGKVKTLAKFLGKDFTVEASKGHIIDLREDILSVDPNNCFIPEFYIVKNRNDVIEKLKKLAKEADKVFLAPDPDREGEAISWHLANILNIDPQSPCRVTFNSITKDEVLKAIENPRPINLNLVSAQQSRRILDRLVGYNLSPLLWKKISKGLSAGRVQSVAVLLICEREKEIISFIPKEYWTVDIFLKTPNNQVFKAKLVKIDNKKPEIANEDEANKIKSELLTHNNITITKITKKPKKRNPPPPFITSTLQQEASTRFSFSPKKTMTIAQKLYEGVELGSEGFVGLITYMRTDSTRISAEGIQAVRSFIQETYGNDYLPPQPREFKSKKTAQDAHEAIRPTNVQRIPEQIAKYLTPDEYKLYSLIWKRFVASQMSEAIYESTLVEIKIDKYIFQASGSILQFDGYTKIYSDSKTESTDSIDTSESADSLTSSASTDQTQELDQPPDSQDSLPEDKDQQLPKDLNVGDPVTIANIHTKQNFTQPPPRYTESSLIRTLEKEGIGRPSTYATIVDTIQQRGYVKKVNGKFYPSDAAFIATEILKRGFSDLINTSFTARMEAELDEIEEGKKDWIQLLKNFYVAFLEDLKKVEKDVSKTTVVTDYKCSKCGKDMVIKFGVKGKFLACSGYPECKNTVNLPDDLILFASGLINNKLEITKLLNEIQKTKNFNQSTQNTSNFSHSSNSTSLISCINSNNDSASSTNKHEYTNLDNQSKQNSEIDIPPPNSLINNNHSIEHISNSDKDTTSNDPSNNNQINHRFNQEKSNLTDQICDKCGAKMAIKKGPYGQFLACSNYPQCKNTKPYTIELDINCPVPNCNGKIIIKRSKTKKIFYSCSNYPNCQFSSWQKPTGKLCPKCNSPMVYASNKKLGNYAKCPSKDCKYQEPLEPLHTSNSFQNSQSNTNTNLHATSNLNINSDSKLEK